MQSGSLPSQSSADTRCTPLTSSAPLGGRQLKKPSPSGSNSPLSQAPEQSLSSPSQISTASGLICADGTSMPNTLCGPSVPDGRSTQSVGGAPHAEKPSPSRSTRPSSSSQQ